MKRTKYRNKKTEVCGMKFDSKAEARYYLYLKGLQEAGKITSLRTQVTFLFDIDYKTLRYVDSNRKIKYVADFEYFDMQGVRKVVDVKGFKTRDYLIKKALMMACNGILVEEVRG